MKSKKEQIELFITASKSMSENILTIPGKSTPYSVKDWQYRISPQHLSEIFEWIYDNRSNIMTHLETSPHAVYCHSKETNLYVSFEIVMDEENNVNFFLHPKSKLASSDNKRISEKELTAEEIKQGSKKSKIINSGGFKTVQYCFQWKAGMKDLSPYTVAVIRHQKGLEEIKQEEKIRKILGSKYVNEGLRGLHRKHNKFNFYTPLAISDQADWRKDSSVNGLKGMGHLEFLNVLYKQAIIIAKLQEKGIFWRDLKGKNFLMVPSSSGQSVKTIAIDFAHARLETDDIKELRNNFGTPHYFSPWNDRFIEIRQGKLEELNLLEKLAQTPQNYSAVRQQILMDIKIIRDSFKRIYTDPRNSCYQQALNAINSYSDPSHLIPPIPERFGLQFLASYRDDAWSFSKLMIEMIETRYACTTEPEYKKELNELYNYFRININKPWQEIHTGQEILKNLEKLLEKMNLEIDDGSKAAKIPLAFFKPVETIKPKNESPVKLPHRFLC